MAVFLSTNTSRECVRLQGDIASTSEELGSCSLRRRESFGMGEKKRRRIRRGGGNSKEEDVVVSRTEISDAMVSAASNSAHPCNGMAKEDMDFSQSDVKGPHSCTEMPQEDMVCSASDPHLCHIKGLYSNRELCREVMASLQGASDIHRRHVKRPHSCNEMSEEDTVPSPSASDDIKASGGTENGPSCSTRGSQLCKEGEKDGLFSEDDGRGITHSEDANPYNKMQQSGCDDGWGIESAPSHGIGSPHSDCERRKYKDMVAESGLGNSHTYATEGLHPYSEMQQRSSGDAMIVENEHLHMTGSPHSAHEMRKQKDTVSESGIGIAHTDGIKGSNPNSIELPHASPEKSLKRPAKLLPCPRCESLDTKFCYFNNYNVNQPRHFCRKCQRYWTAGGSLRNLPVGAGRRKNKHVVSSHQKHPKPSDIHTHVSKGGFAETANESLSSFSASPSSQNHGSPRTVSSISSMVELVTKQSSPSVDAVANLSTTGVYQRVLSEQSSCQGGLGTNEESSRLTGNLNNTSVTKHSTCNATDSSTINPRHVFMSEKLGKQYMAAELQHPDSGMVTEQTAATAKEEADVTSDGNSRPTVGVLPFPYIGPWQFMEPSSACANVPPGMWGGFPWPFIPTMWGPFGNAWNIQWNLSTPFFSSGGSAMPSSLAMMPMPRCGIEETAHPESDGISEPPRSLWVPKTLRIGDPVEAARSSIWSTLGLDDSPGLLDSGRGSISAAFQCKKIGNKKDADGGGDGGGGGGGGGDGNDNDEAKKHLLHTNPAALSRSVMFNEKS